MTSHISWIGQWENQYGSLLKITSDDGGKIEGLFQTALKESKIYGQTLPVNGMHLSNLIAFNVAGGNENGSIIVSYTGMLSEGKMETLWHMVADQKIVASGVDTPAKIKLLEPWEAFVTSLDTFKRK